MIRAPSSLDRAGLVLAVIAVALFARLTLRHVGESYFLADQVDHLQKYEAALRLEPEGLWGPAMSGTEARAIGPFAAVVFGLPLSLGLGINAIHALTSLLIAAATGVAFWQLLRLSPVLAWTWLIVFTAMRIVWWNAAMFWMNTLQLPLGLLLLALFAATVRSPSVPTLLGLVLVLVLALHGHLVALVAVPIVILAVAASRLETLRQRCSRTVAGALLIALALSLLPYLLAESTTRFRNTRAILSHLDAAAQADRADGRMAALGSLVLSTEPLLPVAAAKPLTPIAVWAGLVIAAASLLLFRRRSSSDAVRRASARLLWLLAAAVAGVGWQALFFLLMARPLNGLHYVTLLSPWYAIPGAVLVGGLLPDQGRTRTVAAATLGGAAVLLLMLRTPSLADRYAERTPWTYDAITTAVNTLCGDRAAQTVEGPGLLDELTPAYDSVLQYLMKRGFTRCRYDPAARLAIVANREGRFDDVLVIRGQRFGREEIVPPGIARYRRIE